MSDTTTDPEQEHENTSNTQSISATILFMLSLLLINEMAISWSNKFKLKYKSLSFIQPTTVTTFLGILAGILLNFTDIVNVRSVMKEGFSSFFLIVLLPPIIYESAINMEKEQFFKNFGSIIIYAIFGTLIATIVTAGLLRGVSSMLGMDEGMNLVACFAFGALISATDPVAVLAIFNELSVDKVLFSLIFGESILNDAIAIILFDTTVESRKNSTNVGISILIFLSVFIGSILIGFFIGMATAYVLKHKDRYSRRRQNINNKESQDNRETTILFTIPYVSYLISEGLSMSGIVSIMFCGIAMARYALQNVDPSVQKLNKKLYHTLAYSCENLVFLFMGIGVVSFELAWKQAGFWLIFLACIILLIARFVNIISISFILNRQRNRTKISKKYQFFLWFSGFRGAMAFALALKAKEIFKLHEVGEIMLTITLVFCMINIFLNATVLEPLITRYDIKQKTGPQVLEEEEENREPRNVEGFWNKVKNSVEMCDERCLKKVLLMEKEENSVIDESQSQSTHKETIADIELSENTKKQIKQNLIQSNKDTDIQENNKNKKDKNINLNSINIDENSNREIIKKYDNNWGGGNYDQSSNHIHKDSSTPSNKNTENVDMEMDSPKIENSNINTNNNNDEDDDNNNNNNQNQQENQ